jgi:hypothetical protein
MPEPLARGAFALEAHDPGQSARFRAQPQRERIGRRLGRERFIRLISGANSKAIWMAVERFREECLVFSRVRGGEVVKYSPSGAMVLPMYSPSGAMENLSPLTTDV